MKTIGSTPTGNILLEATPEEDRAIRLLIRVAKGHTYRVTVPFDTSQPLDDDTLAFLNAVREWFDVKDRANALRDLADQIDHALKAT